MRNRYSMVRWRELRVQLDYPRCIWTGVFSNLFVPYKRPRARWGLRPTRRPRGLDLRTGPRRTFILSSLNVSFCQRPVILCERLRSTFDPRFSPLVSMRDNRCIRAVYKKKIKRRKLLKLLQDIVRLVEDIIVRYLKFLWGNQDINLDWLLCFYEILSFS